MSVETATRTIRTYVMPVVLSTVVFALVLAYGPAVWGLATDAVQAVWEGVVAGFTSLSSVVDHFFAIGQHAHPVSGLGCWDEVKASLPTEHLCGDVTGAPAGAVNFTAYPAS